MVRSVLTIEIGKAIDIAMVEDLNPRLDKFTGFHKRAKASFQRRAWLLRVVYSGAL
jgi:hypothetical protein